MKKAALMRLCLCLCLSLLAALPARADGAAARVTLWYPAGDEATLRPVEADVPIEPGRSIAECAVMALLRDPGADDVRQAVPQGTWLRAIHESAGTVVVDLSLDARNAQTNRSMYLMRESVVRTLLGLEGVSCVDVLIDGGALTVSPTPIGAATSVDDEPITRLEQLTNEGGGGRYSREAVIYYPVRDGGSVVPVRRTIDVSGDPIAALLDAAGDADGLDAPTRRLVSVIEPGALSGFGVVTLDDGRRVARLDYPSGARPGAEEIAALCCTLDGFLPGLDGVQIRVDGRPIPDLDGEALRDGVLTGALAGRMIADTTVVYLPDDARRLRPVRVSLSHGDHCSPRLCLRALFEPPEGLIGAAPEGVALTDVRRVDIVDGVAVVDISEHFYASCQALRPAEEKALCAALVETLTRQSGIRAVRVLVEGEPARSLASSVSLEGELTRTPGLVAEDDD